MQITDIVTFKTLPWPQQPIVSSHFSLKMGNSNIDDLKVTYHSVILYLRVYIYHGISFSHFWHFKHVWTKTATCALNYFGELNKGHSLAIVVNCRLYEKIEDQNDAIPLEISWPEQKNISVAKLKPATTLKMNRGYSLINLCKCTNIEEPWMNCVTWILLTNFFYLISCDYGCGLGPWTWAQLTEICLGMSYPKLVCSYMKNLLRIGVVRTLARKCDVHMEGMLYSSQNFVNLSGSMAVKVNKKIDIPSPQITQYWILFSYSSSMTRAVGRTMIEYSTLH